MNNETFDNLQNQDKARENSGGEYSKEKPRGEKDTEVSLSPHSKTTRDDKGDDNAPPMNSPARGPMDQIVPDVPTGSTPLTRHDD